MMAEGEGSRQVVESHWEIALHSSILGDIVDSELPIGSYCIMAFADTACNMFLASVDHVGEMLRVLTNFDDALWRMVCGWIRASRILF